jgi:hypothetical protein
MWLRMRSVRCRFRTPFRFVCEESQRGLWLCMHNNKNEPHSSKKCQEPRCKKMPCAAIGSGKLETTTAPHSTHDAMIQRRCAALANSTAPGSSKLQLPCCLRPAPSSQSIFRNRLPPLLTPLRLLKAIGIMLLFKRKQNGVLSNS